MVRFSAVRMGLGFARLIDKDCCFQRDDNEGHCHGEVKVNGRVRWGRLRVRGKGNG